MVTLVTYLLLWGQHVTLSKYNMLTQSRNNNLYFNIFILIYSLTFTIRTLLELGNSGGISGI